MAKFDYSTMHRVSNELITRFGRQINFERQVQSAGANPWEAQVAATQTFVTTGVVSSYKVREIDGVVIQNGDIRVLCLAVPGVKVGDIFDLDGIKWRAMNIMSAKPGDVLLNFDVNLRKA